MKASLAGGRQAINVGGALDLVSKGFIVFGPLG